MMFDGVVAGPKFYLTASAFMLSGLIWCRKRWDNRLRTPLPPGPPSLPLVGSILSFDDPLRPWLSFSAWRSTYGDIIYARLLSKPVVVVNSEEVAKDLFELRSTIYSDKPQSIVYDIFGSGFHTALLPYGDRWRLHRRILHQQFRQAATPTYHAALRHNAHKMLFNFLQDPASYLSHFEMFTASFILSVIYDYEPKTKDDHFVHMVQRYLELLVAGLGAGTIMVMETFPFILQIPTWFPGATFKRASIKCLQAANHVKEIPFQDVKERMRDGHVPPCFVANTMNRMDGFEDGVIETAVKEVACTSFAGASETSISTLLTFLLAILLHPEVQAKAQAEIDRVVGKDRLPAFHDRQALPYVDAILRETLRWHPVFPLGVPHATTTDDIYKGYFIPKGVIVMANTWAMTHDEKKYPSPDEFKPERFLHEDGSLTSDTMSLAFGWGRRICAGQYVADASIWIAIASFLAVFSIHKALDEHGKEIPVVPKFSTGIAVHPETFPCRIVPRFHDVSVETLTLLTGLDHK
ncbi:cytochrome P450 [Rhizopogon salebrosus TDB-379]|nr:cytochrome P450 [Rhizopogon salebrosus TDB-379]